MAYYQSPRKRPGSTSSRNEVSWIALATGITSEGDNPLYYYGMSINGVLVIPALLCWSTSLAGAGAPPFVSRSTCFNPQMRQSPSHFEESQNGNKSVIEDDANSMPKTYVICQFVLVDTPSSPVQLNPNDVSITVTRFYRPEEFNGMDAYLLDIHTEWQCRLPSLMDSIFNLKNPPLWGQYRFRQKYFVSLSSSPFLGHGFGWILTSNDFVTLEGWKSRHSSVRQSSFLWVLFPRTVSNAPTITRRWWTTLVPSED
nr:DNA (cytosine-5)-methyltransferase 1B [Ipomoea batatas]